MPINASIADEDYGVLANQLLSDMRYEGKLVVACWHHGKIPSLLNAQRRARIRMSGIRLISTLFCNLTTVKRYSLT